MTSDLLTIEVPIDLLTSASEGSILKYFTKRLSTFFDENLLEVALAMTAQGFVKHILTEGDKVTGSSLYSTVWTLSLSILTRHMHLKKIIISRMSPLKDQGGYAVANNYGECLCMCVCGSCCVD